MFKRCSSLQVAAQRKSAFRVVSAQFNLRQLDFFVVTTGLPRREAEEILSMHIPNTHHVSKKCISSGTLWILPGCTSHKEACAFIDDGLHFASELQVVPHTKIGFAELVVLGRKQYQHRYFRFGQEGINIRSHLNCSCALHGCPDMSLVGKYYNFVSINM